MTDIFEKAWWDSLNTQKRDRPELGTISLDGVNAYPLENMKGELNTFREDWRNYPEGDKKERPFNISAFRNLANAGHISPGRLPSGDIRRDTGVLTVKRNFPKIGDSLTSIANFLPLRDPHFDVNRTAQRNAYVLREKDSRPNPQRTEHLWSRGNLEHQELMDLIEGKRSPQEILGMNQEIVLDRNQYGDAQVSWNQGGQAIEAPRFGYDVYDIIDRSLGKNRFQFNNRNYRDDAGHPWRKPLDYKVSGSVDPLLKIPLQFAQNEAPDRVRDSIQQGGGRYLEYVDPSGHRFEGVPVPMNLTGDLRPALSRGISTGTHGIYFDPRDLTNAGLESWDAALSGDVIRRALESIQIRDEMSLEKMPHPASGDFSRRQALPTAFRLQGVKNNPMYSQIMGALRETLGDREMIETFGGGGGLSLGFKPSRAIINDINPDIGNLMRRIIREPMKIDPEQYNVGVGEPITIPHPTLGQMNIGTMTEEMKNRFGEGNRTFIPAHFYNLRNQYAGLREKAASGTATPEEYDKMAEIFYMLQLTGFNSLVRYGKGKELPSWANPYSTPPGTTRSKQHIPEDEELAGSFFQQMKDAGFYDPEKDRYKGRIQPGGNAFRPTPIRGGSGVHDFTPWHDAMKDWDWRTGNAFEFYDDIKNQMKADKNLLTFDPPYFGEEGAHGFFGKDEQERLIQQMIDAKNRGIPTMVFNSMHPSIVEPLREAGFHIEELGRKDNSSSDPNTRGTVGELMAMANIDQDAFQAAWESQRNPQPAQRTLFD
jgi:site-specific DNA-adenine methylase